MEQCMMQKAQAARVHPRKRMKLRMLARPTQLAMLKGDGEGGVAAGWCYIGASSHLCLLGNANKDRVSFKYGK